MVDNKSNVKIMKPGKGDAVSIRHLHETKEDRIERNRAFREQKNKELELKNERFERISNARRNSPSRGGRGINVTIDSDKK